MALRLKTTIVRIAAFSAISLAGVAAALAVPLDGTVTSHEKIVLPRQVAIVVSLIDVSRGDHEITRQRIRPRGGQLPVDFRLHFDAGRIHPDRHYAIQARVELDDKVLFVDRQPLPVDPLRAPAETVIYIHAAAHDGQAEHEKAEHGAKPAHEGSKMEPGAKAEPGAKTQPGAKMEPGAKPLTERPHAAAPSGPVAHSLAAHPAAPKAAVAPAMLIGSEWKAEMLNGRDLPETGEPSLRIDGEHKVFGIAACNRYMGTATINGTALSFGPLAMTKMACAPAVSAVEAEFAKALADTKAYRMDAGHLVFLNAAGQTLLRFKPAR